MFHVWLSSGSVLSFNWRPNLFIVCWLIFLIVGIREAEYSSTSIIRIYLGFFILFQESLYSSIMTKRRKLVSAPVTRIKTEVKEEKPTVGKYLYNCLFCNSPIFIFVTCLFSNLTSIIRVINISYEVRWLASPSPQPGWPGATFFDPFPLTCPIWVILPGAFVFLA
jgi:hypothetical protein